MTKVPFVHPRHQSPLVAIGAKYIDTQSLEDFDILNEIPRFCAVENYSESFGYQWNLFDQTQLDSHLGGKFSIQRFYAETGWKPDTLDNSTVLEVGCGAGRFTEVFLSTTKGKLHSIDYSSAVDANLRNNKGFGSRLILAQASIYELPFPDHSFDRVFCLGVLQHTPSFSQAVAALVKKTRIGGEVVVDFYPVNGWYTKIHSKYLLRPITKRVPKRTLLRIIRFNVPWMLRMFDFLCLLRMGILTRFIPITDIRGFPQNLTPKQRTEWAVMDTFDGLSPQYDNPQRLEAVIEMFLVNGCKVNFAGRVKYESGSAMVIRAVKQVDTQYAGNAFML